ncbi:shufflon system plasmid conjugative transfer pilus tip adhesin PilV, partial [Enterobacter hormaechei subsp. steigerwaltii]|nr:shufflon system plasmid conjugative transfer pilus tip adhesin PilV [Enterobacter hormaechei subsp. steigerwaltii]
NGRMTANEFVQVNGVATAGASCSPNGLIGRDASGGILSCQSGIWRSPGGKPRLTPYTYTNYNSSFNYLNIGVHDFCTSQY